VKNLVADWFSMDFLREKDQNKVRPKPNYTLHPTPSTLNPTPYALNPTPYARHPQP
jgi:hypothetical protein